MPVPVDDSAHHTAPTVIVSESYTDPRTGAVYLHKDLSEVIAPYQFEGHVGPTKASERLGDVASWAEYVKRYAGSVDPYLTWNAKGLVAVLDYHSSDAAGRAQWTAHHPFTYSRQWLKWTALGDGTATTHSAMIEALEDNQEDIVEPDSATLMELLRGLKLTINKNVDMQQREDGTHFIQAIQDQRVAGRQGTADIPTRMSIAIPVFKGHKDKDGNPVLYKMTVRLRVYVTDSKALFRLSIPGQEATADQAIEEQITAARKLLGDKLTLWRAAD